MFYLFFYHSIAVKGKAQGNRSPTAARVNVQHKDR